MSAIVALFIDRNPLLAHAPRAHATGIALERPVPAAPARRRVRRPAPDAPRIHLGPERRGA